MISLKFSLFHSLEEPFSFSKLFCFLLASRFSICCPICFCEECSLPSLFFLHLKFTHLKNIDLEDPQSKWYQHILCFFKCNANIMCMPFFPARQLDSKDNDNVLFTDSSIAPLYNKCSFRTCLCFTWWKENGLERKEGKKMPSIMLCLFYSHSNLIT